jgi:hypothetical protein
MTNSQPFHILSTIQKQLDGSYLNPALITILSRMFESSRRRQVAAGVLFDLTFDQYLSLITKTRRQRMASEFRQGNFAKFMKSQSGYVLTWKDRPSRASGLMNMETACFVNREWSRRNQHFKKGDRHTDASKAAIAASRLGKTHTEETKAAIAAGNTGKVQSAETRKKIGAARTGRKHSEETKRKMAEKRAAYWATRAAAQTCGSSETTICKFSKLISPTSS